MKPIVIEYPPCSTCKKAKRYLKDKGIEFDTRHIVEDTPSKEELDTWIKASKLPIKQFFNTSGQVYRNLNLKEKLLSMSIEDMLILLSENGMLIKRPILIDQDTVLVGFKEKEYETYVNR